MARLRRRISRKQIRQPDQFVTFTGKLFRLFKQYRTPLAASAALLVALLVGLWGWDLNRARQNRLAAHQYARALNLYRGGRYREALDVLTRLSSYRLSHYSRIGLFYQANSHLALNDTVKAIEALEELLRREKRDPLLRQLALLALGSAQERLPQHQGAARSFDEAERTQGPLRDEALLAKARAQAQLGNGKDAIAAYRQYLSTYPATERAAQVSLRIQQLEAAEGQTKGAK